MKKFVIAAVAAAALNTVSAQSCASSFSGFYAGLQAGMNATVSDFKRDAGANFSNTSPSAQSFLGGLFAGYGMGIGSCAYVGGELYVNFNNTNVKIFENQGVKYTAKNTYNYGAKIRLGYTVSQQAMIFLGLGIEQSRWQFKEEFANVAAAGGRQLEFKKNKTSTAFAPSVGMEMFMTKNIFVRGEYTYVTGPKAKFEGADQPFSDTGVTAKFNASQHRFALGLGYKF